MNKLATAALAAALLTGGSLDALAVERGGDMTFGRYADSLLLDPVWNDANVDIWIFTNLYDTLIRSSPDGKNLEPGLATETALVRARLLARHGDPDGAEELYRRLWPLVLGLEPASRAHEAGFRLEALGRVRDPAPTALLLELVELILAGLEDALRRAPGGAAPALGADTERLLDELGLDIRTDRRRAVGVGRQSGLADRLRRRLARWRARRG